MSMKFYSFIFYSDYEQVLIKNQREDQTNFKNEVDKVVHSKTIYIFSDLF